jgi:hypothetical protein
MRYRVNTGLRYPIAGIDAIRAAGGLRNMDQTARAAVRFVDRKPGDIVSDVPRESVAWLVEQGALTPVKDQEPTHG